jgi:polyketide biosynthesis enoyl-CoA hydratase PksI
MEVPVRVNVTTDERHVCSITMDDGEGKNALSEPFVAELEAALGSIGDEARVVVLRGRKDVFCSGADKETLLRVAKGKIAPTDLLLPRAVLAVPVPVIAAMEGHAVGGGLVIGLCADVTILARQSRYGCSFVSMGFTPGMGASRLLESVLSPAIAHELLYSGEMRLGRDFEGRSGFNYIVDREEVLATADEVASRIADKPRLPLRLMKQTLSLHKRRLFEEARTAEALMHEICFDEPSITAWIEGHYD